MKNVITFVCVVICVVMSASAEEFRSQSRVQQRSSYGSYEVVKTSCGQSTSCDCKKCHRQQEEVRGRVDVFHHHAYGQIPVPQQPQRQSCGGCGSTLCNGGCQVGGSGQAIYVDQRKSAGLYTGHYKGNIGCFMSYDWEGPSLVVGNSGGNYGSGFGIGVNTGINCNRQFSGGYNYQSFGGGSYGGGWGPGVAVGGFGGYGGFSGGNFNNIRPQLTPPPRPIPPPPFCNGPIYQHSIPHR